MKATLREDTHPDPDVYYQHQFKIYHDPYLIWDRETWETVLATCDVYRLDVDGRYGGDVILEDRGKGIKYIVDFSVLPNYQGKGMGRSALEQIKNMTERLTAVTREEPLPFFLKSGFVLRKKMKNYYHPGVHGYYVVFERKSAKSRQPVDPVRNSSGPSPRRSGSGHAGRPSNPDGTITKTSPAMTGL